MVEEKPPMWFVSTMLFMLVVSGAWTIAATFPFHRTLRAFSITTVTIGNLGFLFALLSCVLAYVRSEGKQKWRRIMVASFAVGTIFLMASITIYAISVLTGFPFAAD